MTTQRLLGLAEISELYGVSKNTANSWTRQHDFPNPIVKLAMGPVWDHDQVSAWRPPADRDYYQHEIRCAWCGSDKIDDIFPENHMRARTVVCGPCGKTSELYFVVGTVSGDHKNMRLSLKVTKKEGL